MASPVVHYLSPEMYLEQERPAEFKHEYFKGELVAMAGASLAHNRIVSNIIRRVGNLLEGSSCEVLPSDLRVSISSEQTFTYPDATIICDEPQMLDFIGMPGFRMVACLNRLPFLPFQAEHPILQR